MARAPLRVRAHEIEGIAAEFIRPAGRDRDDGAQQLVAMTLRFLGELVIDRIAVFGAFLLQQLERSLPDLAASFLETRNDAGRQPTLAKAPAPLADQRVGLRAKHGSSHEL